MSLTLAHVTFDCADAAKLAQFWSAALGLPVNEGASAGFAAIGTPGPGRQAWMFMQVPEGKTAKNRMHVDLATDDRGREVRRLQQLGATVVGEHDESGSQWTVLADPEGNEFCVM